MKNKLEKLLPILQSSLPPLERALPYLKTIETNRCHSNFGKLFKEFEARLADFFGVETNQVTLVCNGTLALTLSLLAYEIPQNKYCLMPSWTFSATPASAILAGLKPFFLDVDLTTQTLTPDKVHSFLHHTNISPSEIGAIIVVAPFGAPLIRKNWDQFTCDTGIPVIIDAAAGFDTIHRIPNMQPGATPMMVSLHATKIFGIGEGGMLISKNSDFIQRVRGLSNFGFDITKASRYIGTNAKMSEFQAAIGLAVLDSWAEIRAQRLTVTTNYIRMFNELGLDHWLSTEWLSNSCNVLIPQQASELRDYLFANNIESRIWWGKGCHTHPAYQHFKKETDLSNTHALSNCMLALPFSMDTTSDQIDIIGSCIKDYLNSTIVREIS